MSSQLFTPTNKFQVIKFSSILAEQVINSTLSKFKAITKPKIAHKPIRYPQSFTSSPIHKKVQFSPISELSSGTKIKTKVHDGMYPKTNAFRQIIEDYYKGRLPTHDHIIQHPLVTPENIEFIYAATHALFCRIVQKKSTVILPGGGTSIKLNEQHLLSLYTLFKNIYIAGGIIKFNPSIKLKKLYTEKLTNNFYTVFPFY